MFSVLAGVMVLVEGEQGQKGSGKPLRKFLKMSEDERICQKKIKNNEKVKRDDENSLDYK